MNGNVPRHALPGASRLTAITMTVFAVTIAAAAESAPTAPDRLTTAVAEFFANQPDHQPGDLITQSQAESLLAVLDQAGFQFADVEEIVAAVPPDDDYLAVTLRTPAGRRFMRQIGPLSGGFDRLDRLARLPHGKQTIHDLIRGPDGYKMIEYLTTTRGGQATGQMLSHAPQGAGFNRATGRIYTAEALLAALKRSVAAD